jgi:parvulin-like peptidyl-prolyl isomerase
MIRTALISITLALTLSGSTSWARQDAPEESTTLEMPASKTADLVVARISGRPVSESQVIEAIDEIARQKEMSLDQMRQRNALLFDEAFNSLTTITLLKNQARRQNLPTDDTLVDRQIEQLTDRYASPEAFEKALTEQGLTESELRQSLKESIGMQQLITMITRDTPQVTDADIEDFYQKNQDKFLMPERVHVAHIMMRTNTAKTGVEKAAIRELLEAVRNDIESGVITFSEAAARYSHDESNADKGGDLGLFARGETLKLFEDIAFSTWPGTVSPTFETPVGFHILHVLELHPEGPATLEVAAAAVREFLEQQFQRTATQNYVEKLKQEAVIETFMTREEFVRRHSSE